MGAWLARAFFDFGVAYAVVVVAGFVSLGNVRDPLPDPYLALAEIQTLEAPFQAVYEAGPTGYGLSRHAAERGRRRGVLPRSRRPRASRGDDRRAVLRAVRSAGAAPRGDRGAQAPRATGIKAGSRPSSRASGDADCSWPAEQPWRARSATARSSASPSTPRALAVAARRSTCGWSSP